MKVLLRMFVLSLFLSFVACINSGQDYVESFDEFVENVKENCDDYNEKDWQKADKKFELYSNKYYEKYKKELTKDEIRQVAKLKGTYMGLKLKSGAKSVLDGAKNLIDQAGSALDEMSKKTKE